MRVLQWALDLLYPPKCMVCQRLLEPEQRDLCPQCRTALTLQARPPRKPRMADSAVAVYVYDDALRPSLLRYKFGGKACYARSYGPMLAEKLRQQEVEFDLITWVPVSRKRRRKRGYDQAQLLAQQTAKALGTKAVPILRKVRDNMPQSRIQDAARRKANVSGVYKLRPGIQVQEKRILLIDDIMTTGATLDEAALVLRTAHAASVQVAVFAAAGRAK